MEPLDPNDPLWNLLGKARRVEPRPNFTRNVLRTARQTPQAAGWWAALMSRFQDQPASLPRMLAGVAAAVVVAAAAVLQWTASEPATMAQLKPSRPHAVAVTVVEAPILAVEAQLESMDQVSALLALEDTSSLTDSEISFLLY